MASLVIEAGHYVYLQVGQCLLCVIFGNNELNLQPFNSEGDGMLLSKRSGQILNQCQSPGLLGHSAMLHQPFDGSNSSCCRVSTVMVFTGK